VTGGKEAHTCPAAVTSELVHDVKIGGGGATRDESEVVVDRRDHHPLDDVHARRERAVVREGREGPEVGAQADDPIECDAVVALVCLEHPERELDLMRGDERG